MGILLNEFYRGIDERFPDDSSIMTYSEWVTKNTRLRNRPFSYKGYEFQRQIMDDMHPNLSVIKLSQVGLTEVQLRKFFAFLKRNIGTSGIFALPSQPMRDRLSQTRVKTLIEHEPVFNGPMVDKPVRQKGIYQVDQSFGYFTGATEGEATSIPADIFFSDEVDLADQQMLSLFQSRLQASQWRITQRFSTPTYYGYGIDASYSVSDKHEYHYRCPACNHWQIPEFHPRFLNLPGLRPDQEDLSQLTIEEIHQIDTDGSYVRCERCGDPADLANPLLREWVPEFPARKARGYRVRPFSVANITIPYILEQLIQYIQKDNLKGWHNTVIGEPYNDSNARISEEDVRACSVSPATPSPLPAGSLFLGCDVGQTCHVTIGTSDHIFEFIQVRQSELYDFIKGRLQSMPIIQGCIDMYPYTPTAESIRDIEGHRGKIMPVGYATTANAAAMKDHKDEFERVVHYVANRTKAIDVVARRCRVRDWRFSGYGHNHSLLITHLRDMIRIEQPDEPPVWNKISGNDHWLHSLALQQMAVRMKAGMDYSSDADPRSHALLYGINVLTEKHKTPYAEKRPFNGSLGM